jgi:hypothetical protein
MGQAAFWIKGEWHESGSQIGMTAIVAGCANSRFTPSPQIPALEEFAGDYFA